MIRPGFIAVKRRGSSGPVPTGAHRYWRILFDGVTGSNRVNLAEIEFLDKRFYRRMDGVFTASGSTSGAVAPSYACDRTYTRSTSSEWWASNQGSSGDIWFKIDAGLGFEFICEGVTFAKGGLGNTFTGFSVQWSDDDSTWTTEWYEDNLTEFYSLTATAGGYSNTDRPVSWTNPNVPTFTPEPGFDQTGVLLWLKSWDGVFTDEFTTPAVNNDAVQTITNHAGGSFEFRQTVLANKPIYRTGGEAGLPYIEFESDKAHYLEDIALAMASGLSTLPAGRTGILADVNIKNGVASPIMGDIANYKNNIGFIAWPNRWIRAASVVWTDVPDVRFSGPLSFGMCWNYSGSHYRTIHISNDYGHRYGAASGGITIASAAVTSTQLFRGVEISASESLNTTFKGKVYEWIYMQSEDFDNSFTQVQAYYIQQYLLGRSIVGLGGPLPDEYYFLPNNDPNDRFDTGTGDLLITR